MDILDPGSLVEELRRIGASGDQVRPRQVQGKCRRLLGRTCQRIAKISGQIVPIRE